MDRHHCPGSVALPVISLCADVSRSIMIDVTELVRIVFSGLSVLVIEDIRDAGGVIFVYARTRAVAVACPGCGVETGRVHGYRERTAADVSADGRHVLVKVRARRMRCPVRGCRMQTFREQVPGVLDRYQRRTARLTVQVSAVAREFAGRASARLLPALGIAVLPAHDAACPAGDPAARAGGAASARDGRLRAAPRPASMRPCSSTPRPASASTLSPAAPPTSRRNGCGTIPGSRSCAGTGRGLRRGGPPGAAGRGAGQ